MSTTYRLHAMYHARELQRRLFQKRSIEGSFEYQPQGPSFFALWENIVERTEA